MEISNLKVEISPSNRANCAICFQKIVRGEYRIHMNLSNYHVNCFIKVICSIPEIREMVNKAIEELTIERLNGE